MKTGERVIISIKSLIPDPERLLTGGLHGVRRRQPAWQRRQVEGTCRCSRGNSFVCTMYLGLSTGVPSGEHMMEGERGVPGVSQASEVLCTASCMRWDPRTQSGDRPSAHASAL